MNKKVAAGVAVTVAIASVATNLAFQPDELLHDQAYLEAHTRTVQLDGQQPEAEIEYTEPEELSRTDTLRNRLLRLPVPVKALLLLPLWALGAVPVAIGTSLFSGVSPVLSYILSFLLQAGVLAGVFCAVYKLVFPDRSIKELFKKKNRRWLLLGAAAITGADMLLGLFWSGWSAVRIVLLASGGFGILCLLWRRICGRFKEKEPGVVHTKLKLEY